MNTFYRINGEPFLMTHGIHPKGEKGSSLHYHNAYEMFVMVNGSAVMLVKDKLVDISKGDVVLLNPSCLHKNNGGMQHERYALHFTEKYFEEYFSKNTAKSIIQKFNNGKLQLKQKPLSEFIGLLRKIEKSGDYLYAHIAEMISILDNPKNLMAQKSFVREKTVSEKILEYINENYARISGLDEIAAIMQISKQHMCAVFKRETDITITEYLNSVRINTACEILKEGKLNIMQTASACGYSSPMNFRKIFKQITGMTPNEYKNYETGKNDFDIEITV